MHEQDKEFSKGVIVGVCILVFVISIFVSGVYLGMIAEEPISIHKTIQKTEKNFYKYTNATPLVKFDEDCKMIVGECI